MRDICGLWPPGACRLAGETANRSTYSYDTRCQKFREEVRRWARRTQREGLAVVKSVAQQSGPGPGPHPPGAHSKGCFPRPPETLCLGVIFLLAMGGGGAGHEQGKKYERIHAPGGGPPQFPVPSSEVKLTQQCGLHLPGFPQQGPGPPGPQVLAR